MFKLDILSNKFVENSEKSVVNRTIQGNPYYLVRFEIVLYQGSYYLSEFVLSGNKISVDKKGEHPD